MPTEAEELPDADALSGVPCALLRGLPGSLPTLAGVPGDALGLPETCRAGWVASGMYATLMPLRESRAKSLTARLGKAKEADVPPKLCNNPCLRLLG